MDEPFTADFEGPDGGVTCEPEVLGVAVGTGVIITLLVDREVRVEANEAALVRAVGTSGGRGLATSGNFEPLAVGRTDAELFLPFGVDVGVVGPDGIGVDGLVRDGVTALKELLLATLLLVLPFFSFSLMFDTLVLASEPLDTKGLIPPLIVPLLTTPVPLLSSSTGSPVRLGPLLPSATDWLLLPDTPILTLFPLLAAVGLLALGPIIEGGVVANADDTLGLEETDTAEDEEAEDESLNLLNPGTSALFSTNVGG